MKKSVLISGILVAGAACATAFALSQSAPQFAEIPADAPVLPVKATYPAANASVPTSDNLSQIYIDYNLGTSDNGISVNREVGNITVSKDGTTVQTIDVENTAKVYADSRYITRLIVNLNEPLTEAGQYTVSLPRGIASGPVKGEAGDNDAEATDSYSQALNLKFRLVYSDPYTVSPAPGEVSVGAMQNITITYADASAIALNANAGAIQLIKHDNAAAADAEGNTNNETVVGTYTPSVSGNTVTLKLNATEDIQASSAKIEQLYYYISVPAGEWTVTSAQGANANVALTLGNYALRAFAASDWKVKSPATAASMESPKIQCAQSVKISNPNGIISLKIDGATVMQYNVGEINSTGKVLTLVPKVSTTYASNVKYLISGNYVLSIPANLLINDNNVKNTAVDIPLVITDGTTELLPFKSSPAMNGVATSIQSVTLTFGTKVTMVNENADIIVKKDGKQINTVKSGSTTSSVKGGKTATAVTIKMLSASTKETGVYTFEYPAGVFKSGDVTNPAFTIKAYIPEFKSFTTMPVQVWDDPDQDLSEIKEIILLYPEGSVLTQAPTFKASGFANGYTTVKNATTAHGKNGSVTSLSGSINNNYPDVTLDGNKVVLKYNTPFVTAFSSGYYFGITIPAGSWMISENGAEAIPNTEVSVFFGMHTPKTPVFTLDGEEINPDKKYTAEEFLSSAILCTFEQSCYVPGTNEAWTVESPVLKNAAGENVANLSFSTPDGTQKAFTVKIPSGTTLPETSEFYTIEFPANSIQFGSSNATSALAFLNPAAYSAKIFIDNNADGVDFIGADNSFTVVTLDGKVVLRNAAADALGALEPGFYIINGKKVIVKK
ncbi:MAG: hypothetical protein NC328_02255 [Muribaculum sp.]|nr:hypothetical protein [Muribaculum sp.]